MTAGAALLAVALAASGDHESIYRRKVVASDGVALAMFRYVPVGGGQGAPPVLLLPDVGMGREAYDLRASGLARWLVSRGREVYLLEPRGAGRSDKPKRWRLADVAQRDLPAAVAAIRAQRDGPVDLVVHGWTGALALAAASAELAPVVRRVVAINTPVDAEPPNATTEVVLADGGRFSSLGPEFELLFSRGGNLEAGALSELRTTGFSDLGPAASADLLGWMRSGDLAFGDGTTLRGRLARYDRPTLQLLALHDAFAHPEFASRLREVSRAKVKVKVLTRIELLKEDYGHLSVLHGQDAAKDVFKPIGEFLSAPEAE